MVGPDTGKAVRNVNGKVGLGLGASALVGLAMTRAAADTMVSAAHAYASAEKKDGSIAYLIFSVVALGGLAVGAYTKADWQLLLFFAFMFYLASCASERITRLRRLSNAMVKPTDFSMAYVASGLTLAAIFYFLPFTVVDKSWGIWALIGVTWFVSEAFFRNALRSSIGRHYNELHDAQGKEQIGQTEFVDRVLLISRTGKLFDIHFLIFSAVIFSICAYFAH